MPRIHLPTALSVRAHAAVLAWPKCLTQTTSPNFRPFACPSLPTAGGHWEKASELFEQMQTQGCKPDSITYCGLITAYERGGQWRRALKAFEQMQAQVGALRTTCETLILYRTCCTRLVWHAGAAPGSSTCLPGESVRGMRASGWN